MVLACAASATYRSASVPGRPSGRPSMHACMRPSYPEHRARAHFMHRL